MSEQKTQQNDNFLPERRMIPRETQVRIANQRRKLAIARYQLNVRKGSLWIKGLVGAKIIS